MPKKVISLIFLFLLFGAAAGRAYADDDEYRICRGQKRECKPSLCNVDNCTGQYNYSGTRPICLGKKPSPECECKIVNPRCEVSRCRPWRDCSNSWYDENICICNAEWQCPEVTPAQSPPPAEPTRTPPRPTAPPPPPPTATPAPQGCGGSCSGDNDCQKEKELVCSDFRCRLKGYPDREDCRAPQCGGECTPGNNECPKECPSCRPGEGEKDRCQPEPTEIPVPTATPTPAPQCGEACNPGRNECPNECPVCAPDEPGGNPICRPEPTATPAPSNTPIPSNTPRPSNTPAVPTPDLSGNCHCDGIEVVHPDISNVKRGDTITVRTWAYIEEKGMVNAISFALMKDGVRVALGKRLPAEFLGMVEREGKRVGRYLSTWTYTVKDTDPEGVYEVLSAPQCAVKEGISKGQSVENKNRGGIIGFLRTLVDKIFGRAPETQTRSQTFQNTLIPEGQSLKLGTFYPLSTPAPVLPEAGCDNAYFRVVK